MVVYVVADNQYNQDGKLNARTGHQLLDHLSAFVISQMFGFTYVNQPNPNLDFFNLAEAELQLADLNRKGLKTIKIDLGWVYQPIVLKRKLRRYRLWDKNQKVLLIVKGRIVISRVYNWYLNQKIQRNVYLAVIQSLRQKFKNHHQTRETYFDSQKINIALHVRRGNELKTLQQHLNNSHQRSYRLPIEYFSHIVDQLVDKLAERDYQVHIYTEIMDSQDVIEEFQDRPNCVLHIAGQDQAELNAVVPYGKAGKLLTTNFPYPYDDLFHLATSDILVLSNSCMSEIAGLLNPNLKIYNPYEGFENLPADEFIIAESDSNSVNFGQFDPQLIDQFSVSSVSVANGVASSSGVSSNS